VQQEKLRTVQEREKAEPIQEEQLEAGYINHLAPGGPNVPYEYKHPPPPPQPPDKTTISSSSSTIPTLSSMSGVVNIPIRNNGITSTTSSPSLIYIDGYINRIPCVIMADSGASHNFISHTFLEEHKARITTSSSHVNSVRLGDGLTTPTNGKQVKGAILSLCSKRNDQETIDFASVDLHSINLGNNCDIVAGLPFWSQAKINIKYHNLSTSSFAPTSTTLMQGIEYLTVCRPLNVKVDKRARHDGQIRPVPILCNLVRKLNDVFEFDVTDKLALMVLTLQNKGVKLLREGRHENLDKEAEKVTKLLMSEYRDVFADPGNGPPAMRDCDMPMLSIDLEQGKEPRSRPYIRLSAEKENILHDLIKEMIKNGWIKSSSSRYASATFLVPKADGGWRMVVDYRALNAIVPLKTLIPYLVRKICLLK